MTMILNRKVESKTPSRRPKKETDLAVTLVGTVSSGFRSCSLTFDFKIIEPYNNLPVI